jgi:hypothetical protein
MSRLNLAAAPVWRSLEIDVASFVPETTAWSIDLKPLKNIVFTNFQNPAEQAGRLIFEQNIEVVCNRVEQAGQVVCVHGGSYELPATRIHATHARIGTAVVIFCWHRTCIDRRQDRRRGPKRWEARRDGCW